MQSPALSAACPACPVETTLTLISDKWKVLILRDLMPGTKRFGELKKSIGTVTQKVLTAQLRQMEASGLLTRTVYAEVPPRVEYTLTDLGRSLRPVLDAMEAWGKAYQENARCCGRVLSQWAVAFRPMMPTSSRAAKNIRAAVAGSLKITIPSTTAPRAPIPVQTAYAVPMGKVFTAWAKSQTLAAIAATVRTEYPTLVKPSDSFIAVTQTISRHPAANRQIHAITPSSFSHQ